MKICFVSYEIAPTTKGGAGALIANAIKSLEDDPLTNNEIVLLLDIPVEEYVRFEWHDRLSFPNYENIRAYRVDELCFDLPDDDLLFSSFALRKSYRFDWALRKLLQIETPDIVEFFDYNGPGYIPISQKILGKYPQDVGLTIRYHLTMQPIHKNTPYLPDEDILLSYRMEARSIELAERILFPSKVILDEAALTYNISSKSEVYISPPSLKRLPQMDEALENSKDTILFLGYLDFRKGADIFLSACLSFLSEEPVEEVKFLLVGGGFQQAPAGFSNFKEYLQARIPLIHQTKFIFTDQISHQQLSQLLPQVRFAVIPSFIESFGYAAHELYAVGIPIIVRNIPVFNEYFHHEENALVFDGSVEDLVKQMKRMWNDESLRSKISKPYDVLPEPLGNCYHQPVKPRFAVNPADDVQFALRILILTKSKRETTQLPFDFCNIWQLSHEKNADTPPFPFLGKLWWIYDRNGQVVPLPEWRSNDLMIVLTENDVVDPSFIQKAVRILSCYPEFSFVGCWREGEKIYPIDAASEILPLIENSIPTRLLYRTRPNVHLFDLFDNRMGCFSEIGYLWKLEEEIGKGLIIPEKLIKTGKAFFENPQVHLPEFNFLFMNSSTERQAKIGHFLAAKFASQPSAGAYPHPDNGVSADQEIARLKLAELDLKLLLKKLSYPPLGWLFKTRRNFRTLLERYLEN